MLTVVWYFSANLDLTQTRPLLNIRFLSYCVKVPSFLKNQEVQKQPSSFKSDPLCAGGAAGRPAGCSGRPGRVQPAAAAGGRGAGQGC